MIIYLILIYVIFFKGFQGLKNPVNLFLYAIFV